MEKDPSLIPEGPYCYTPIGWEGNTYRIKLCPYFQKKNGNSWCAYLEEGEDDPLLWDQCKICGENND